MVTTTTHGVSMCRSTRVHRLGHPSLPRTLASLSLIFPGLCLPSHPRVPRPAFLASRGAAPHSSFPLTAAPLQTLNMDVWGPARVSGQGCERNFLLVVDDYTQYTTVFPLRSKGQVVDVLILWIRAVRLQLRERFRQDLPVLRLHSDGGGEFSSDLLRDFCHGEGILQAFMLLESPQKNGIAERRISLVMEVARTSMIHVAAPHFLWAIAGPAPSGLSKVDPLHGTVPVEVARDSGVARGIVCGGAESGGAEPGGAESEGAGSGGAGSGGAESGGAQPRGPASSGGLAGALPRLSPRHEPLSPQQLREWLVRRARLSSGAAGAGATGDTEAVGAGVTAGAGGSGGTAAVGPGGSRTRGTRAAKTGDVGGAGDVDPTEPGAAGAGGTGAGGTGAGGAGAGGVGAGGTSVGGAGAGGAGVVDPGARGAGGTGATGTVRSRPYFVPPLQQVLGVPSSPSLTPLLCPPLDLSRPPLPPASPLPAPSPYTEHSGSLTERLEPASCPVLPVRTARRVPRSRPPPFPGTHAMALRPSSVPPRVPLLPPPESSLPAVPDPESDLARAASPIVSRLLAIVVTDPSFETTAAFSLVAELLDFAAACRLDYATALVAESESASPLSVGAMDAEMASWKSTGSPPALKARYVARGFSQRQGVDYFQTFSPTLKMTTLRVLLHVTAQRDYELHSLDFSTAFLQGSLHEEILLRSPPGFTGSFPAGTQWSLRWPVNGLR
ncbi:unnamed protein product [Closterium sp. NIES-54]